MIAICHTPWKRILVQWCLEEKFGLIVGGGKWSHQKKTIQRFGSSFSDLRNIIKYLKQNGRLVMAADAFNSLDYNPVMFLGIKYNSSAVPVRLAIMAGVPLIVVMPKLTSRSINFLIGPTIQPEDGGGKVDKKMNEILSFFEVEIERDPSMWSRYTY